MPTLKRRIEDFGEKIGGARKDFHVRLPSVDEVESMSAIERAGNIVKANIWPTPDYVRMVEGGMDVGVAYLLKQLRDAIGAKLGVRELRQADAAGVSEAQAFANYAEAVAKVRDAAADVTSLEGFQRIMEPLAEEFESWPEEKRAGNPACDYSVKRRLRVIPWEWRQATQTALKKGWPQTQSPEAKLIHRWQLMAIRDADGTPGEDWIISIQPRWGHGPKTDAEKALAKALEQQRFGSESDAAHAIKEAVAAHLREARAQKRAGQPEARPHLASVERVGLPDYRLGRDVTEEDFREEFGFRGGEFGNWMTQEDRRQTLNFAYDALCDMSDVLGLPRKAMSLNGRLAIAFGARGHGGRYAAAAHYEPGRRVFNFTKPSGAGCVAHEWMHALDHELGDLAGIVNPMRPYLSENTKRPVRAAMHLGADKAQTLGRIRDMLSEIHTLHQWRPATREESVAIAEQGMKKISQTIDSWFRHRYVWCRDEQAGTHELTVNGKARMASPEDAAEWGRLRTELVYGHGGMSDLRKLEAIAIKYFGKEGQMDRKMISAQEGNLALKQGRLQRIEKAVDGLLADRVSTDLWKSLEELDKERSKAYWTTDCEVAARAFEAFVFDRVRASGGRSDYLVYGVTDPRIYATGELRIMLSEKWIQFTGELQTVYGKVPRKEITPMQIDRQASDGRLSTQDQSVSATAESIVASTPRPAQSGTSVFDELDAILRLVEGEKTAPAWKM